MRKHFKLHNRAEARLLKHFKVNIHISKDEYGHFTITKSFGIESRKSDFDFSL
jgi:hypothetical protein